MTQKIKIETVYNIAQPIPEEILKELLQVVKTKIGAQLLYNRGITTIDDYENTLSQEKIQAPTTIANISDAVKTILKHIKNKSRIVIYGDYDADGILATSIVWDYIYRKLNYKNIHIYIPDRIEEGYGLSDQGIKKLKEADTDLIITVDCGIRSTELINHWKTKGIDFIVTDHHNLPDTLPDTIVVHPNHFQSLYGDKHTSGTNVAWKLITELDSFLNKTKYYSYTKKYIDLVALSIITDVMPMQAENKAIVKYGLKKLQKAPNLGLTVLYEIATSKKLTETTLSTYDLGFILGPRINATGRLGDPLDALRLILTEKMNSARTYASKLHELNTKRQQLTKTSTEEAMQNIQYIDNKLAVVYSESWNEGIIGLIAGNISKITKLPTFAITKNQEGFLKASGRAPTGFHITEFAEHASEILATFGGHAGACGFTSKTQDLDKLIEHFKEITNLYYSSYTPQYTINIDYVAKSTDININVLDDIALIAPFGPENSEPIIMVKDKISDINTDKNNKHTFFKLNNLKAILWNNTTPIEYFSQGDEIQLLGRLKQNNFNGNTYIDLIINDIINTDIS